MRTRTIVSMILIISLVSGCGKVKKKSIRFSQAYRDERNDIEYYERPEGFYKKYFDEMIEEAKEVIPEEVKKITTFKVDIEQYYQTRKNRADYKELIDGGTLDCEIQVDKIECDVDSMTYINCRALEYNPDFPEEENPQGILLWLMVEMHVMGTNQSTGEYIDDVFLSPFQVARQGMTMTEDGSEIIDEGHLEFDCSFLNTSCFKFCYWQIPLQYTQKPHKPILDKYCNAIACKYEYDALFEKYEPFYTVYSFHMDYDKVWSIEKFQKKYTYSKNEH